MPLILRKTPTWRKPLEDYLAERNARMEQKLRETTSKALCDEIAQAGTLHISERGRTIVSYEMLVQARVWAKRPENVGFGLYA